jgi:MFS family permease
MPENNRSELESTPPLGLFWPVTAMLGTQTVSVLVCFAVPVMATEMSADVGLRPETLGAFTSVLFVFAMFFSAASGSFIVKFGGVRANQIGMSFSAICLLLTLTAWPPAIFLAAALVGLGYGPNTPSGSHVLARVTPPRARGLVFSLKQSGAPLGGLVAGLLIPFVVSQSGWRGAILVAAAISLAAVVLVQPLRARLDDDRVPNQSVGFGAPWQAISLILRRVALRRLTFLAFSLTSIQSTVMAFLVIYLVRELEIDFTTAGAIFAASQLAGALFRVLVGWLADRYLGPKLPLVTLAICAALSLFALGTLTPDSPLITVTLLSLALGASSFGWNGVFLAAIANLAGVHGVGTATGGSLFFLYGGLVFGPIVMSGLVTATGGYEVPFLIIGLLGMLSALNLLRPDRASV